MSDLGARRLQAHEEAAGQRDQRMTGWNRRKSAEWHRGLSPAEWLTLGPRGFRQNGMPEIAEQLDLAWIHAIALLREGRPEEALAVRKAAIIRVTTWAQCACGRPYQPGERGYRQCYACSQASYAEGSTACAICQRRHSMKYPCCKACTEGGREDVASLLRSVVLRRDGWACAACGTDEGQMDVHHINPQGSAWAWNCEVLCVPCWIVFRASGQYNDLDELHWLDRALAYDSYLHEYLREDERVVLREQLRAELGSDFRSRPPRQPYAKGECHAIDGLVNVLDAFGRDGVVVEHI